jgi:hypothetical protein
MRCFSCFPWFDGDVNGFVLRFAAHELQRMIDIVQTEDVRGNQIEAMLA